MEERLKILRAELDALWKEILKLYASVEKKNTLLKANLDNEDLAINLAYKLHNLYSAYEDMFKLTAHFFENQIDDLPGYHIGLLKRMTVDIEDIRPRVLSEDSFKLLDELRGFRHVFRHAYTYELEAERIVRLADKSLRLKDIFSKDFKIFQNKL